MEQERENRTERHKMTGKTGQAELGQAESGQAEQERYDRTGRTRLQGQESRTGQAEQDFKDRTAEQDRQNRTG
jgi:hypothetical protein